MSNWILIDDGYYSSPAAGDIDAVVSTNPCYLYRVDAVNLTASEIYVQIHDANVLPGNGTAPMAQFAVAANGFVSFQKQLPLYRWRMQKGLVVAVSTTAGSLTVAVSKSAMLYVYFTQ